MTANNFKVLEADLRLVNAWYLPLSCMNTGEAVLFQANFIYLWVLFQARGFQVHIYFCRRSQERLVLAGFINSTSSHAANSPAFQCTKKTLCNKIHELIQKPLCPKEL